MTKTIFITGANRGIGLALTRLWLHAGAKVHATCRHPSAAMALKALGEQYSGRLTISPFNVNDDGALHQQATQLNGQSIDALILNAGIYGDKTHQLDNLRNVFMTNSFSPLYLANELLENVSQSQDKLIVAITSKMGSIGDDTSGGSYAYRGSKAALNAMLYAFALDVQTKGIKVLLLHPGWVQTDMGGPNATTTVEKSAQGLMTIMQQAHHYKTGHFLDYQGRTIPW